MTAANASSPKFQFFNNNGQPLVGGQVTMLDHNSGQPSATWQDQAQTTLNSNPIILDARGECLIWLDPLKQYDLQLNDSVANGGALIYTVANVLPNGAAAAAALVPSGMRNRIINGKFNINQYSPVANIANANQVYCMDRWELLGVNIPGGFGVGQGPAGHSQIGGGCMFMATTTTAAPGAGTYQIVRQMIEAGNITDLQAGTAGAQSFTLQFYASVSIGNFVMGVSFGWNNGANSTADARTYVTSVNLTSVPQLFTITVPADTNATAAGMNLSVKFCFDTGANFQTANTGIWQAGDFYAPTTQTHGGNSTANVFVADVQLEKGITATSYEFRSVQQEYELCLYYYRTSYEPGVNPGSVNALGVTQLAVPSTTVAAAIAITERFGSPMRIPPNFKAYSPGSGAVNFVRDNAGTADRAASYAGIGRRGVVVVATIPAGLTETNVSYHYTAFADFF